MELTKIKVCYTRALRVLSFPIVSLGSGFRSGTLGLSSRAGAYLGLGDWGFSQAIFET
jgi:hypothetical protein